MPDRLKQLGAAGVLIVVLALVGLTSPAGAQARADGVVTQEQPPPVGPCYGFIQNSQFSSYTVTVVTARDRFPLLPVLEHHALSPGETWIGDPGNPAVGFRVSGIRIVFSALFTEMYTNRYLGYQPRVPAEPLEIYWVDPCDQAFIETFDDHPH